MKKLLSSILFIFLFFTNTVFSEQKIAFIDMDKVISTSKAGSLILKQLTDLNKKNLNFFKEEEKKLKEKEKKLISQKNIISEKDFKNKVNELKSEISNYNQNRNKILTDFNKLKIDNTNDLLKLINPILVKFSNDKVIAIILKKKDLVVAKTQLDITDEVIKIVNSEVKEFKINE
jgi:outer membrane protein